MATDTETCGCHVHVGSLDRETAIVVINHLRPWLPTLLALSTASAPSGASTSYASPRTIALSRWPTVQIPPHFTCAAHYDETLAALQRGGVLPRGANACWLARPSLHLTDALPQRSVTIRPPPLHGQQHATACVDRPSTPPTDIRSPQQPWPMSFSPSCTLPCALPETAIPAKTSPWSDDGLSGISGPAGTAPHIPRVVCQEAGRS
ncbi:glutamate-cysteine ligase family protein [Streptomyces sp. NPDC029674]|uniref:glutamate-cysteine ligase family protein n=1 Tax=Streptomyces sp. NPDC029674 TaxID=3365297 RepID=UPI00384ECBFE